MACRLIKNTKGEVKGVFQKDGTPSILFDYIQDNIKNNNVAYGAYLSMVAETEVDPDLIQADPVIVTETPKHAESQATVVRTSCRRP